MDIVSEDLLALVFSHLKLEDYKSLSQTNRFLHLIFKQSRIWTEIIRLQFKIYVSPADNELYLKTTSEFGNYYIGSDRYVPINEIFSFPERIYPAHSSHFLKLACEDLVYSNSMMIGASRMGWDKVVDLMLERGAKSYSEAIVKAAAGGHLEIMKKLCFETQDINIVVEKAACAAAANGHLDIIKFIINKYSGECNYLAYMFVPIIDIIVQPSISFVGSISSGCALEYASEAGHYAIVKYLAEQFPDHINARAIWLAAANKHNDILDYLTDGLQYDLAKRRTPEQERQLEAIILGISYAGDVDRLEMLLSQVDKSNIALIAAAGGGHLSLVHKYHNPSFLSGKALDIAAHEDHLDVVQYLTPFQSEDFIIQLLENGYRIKNRIIFEYLFNKVTRVTKPVVNEILLRNFNNLFVSVLEKRMFDITGAIDALDACMIYDDYEAFEMLFAYMNILKNELLMEDDSFTDLIRRNIQDLLSVACMSQIKFLEKIITFASIGHLEHALIFSSTLEHAKLIVSYGAVNFGDCISRMRNDDRCNIADFLTGLHEERPDLYIVTPEREHKGICILS